MVSVDDLSSCMGILMHVQLHDEHVDDISLYTPHPHT